MGGGLTGTRASRGYRERTLSMESTELMHQTGFHVDRAGYEDVSSHEACSSPVPGPHSHPAPAPGSATQADIELLRHHVRILSDELSRVYRSRSWKLVQVIRQFARPGRLKRAAFAVRRAVVYRRGARANARLQRAFPDLCCDTGVNLGHQLSVQFAHHRCGWTYAVQALSVLNRRSATYLDVYAEGNFGYRGIPSPIYARPWAGICHVPTAIPEWLPEMLRRQFFPYYSLSPAWLCAVPACVGLFALSEAHARELRASTGLPVCTLLHPTEIPSLQWSMDRFLANRRRKVVQIGWFLRKLHAIFQARFPGYEKVFLSLKGQRHVEDYFAREEEYLLGRGEFRKQMLETATTLPYVSNREYDALLSENIAFLDLYGASANNAVIECIARGTPLLVNPLPAVREYLGNSYPLYYSSYEEAERKASDLDLLHEAHLCLRSPQLREKISAQTFLRTFMSSTVYKAMGRA